MVGAYLCVGIVWAWLMFELSVYDGKEDELREFGFWANVFASSQITLLWPLSMLRVARYLFKG